MINRITGSPSHALEHGRSLEDAIAVAVEKSVTKKLKEQRPKVVIEQHIHTAIEQHFHPYLNAQQEAAYSAPGAAAYGPILLSVKAHLDAVSEKPSPEDLDISKWRKELSHFETMRADLYSNPRYRLKFVAIDAGKVVDEDCDKFCLAARIEKRFPGKVVLIAQVRLGSRVADFPSPELA